MPDRVQVLRTLPSTVDPVEAEYNKKIEYAIASGKDDEAFELSIGLRQYQDMYKDTSYEFE